MGRRRYVSIVAAHPAQPRLSGIVAGVRKGSQEESGRVMSVAREGPFPGGIPMRSFSSAVWCSAAAVLILSAAAPGRQPGPADPGPLPEKPWKEGQLLHIGDRN